MTKRQKGEEKAKIAGANRPGKCNRLSTAAVTGPVDVCRLSNGPTSPTTFRVDSGEGENPSPALYTGCIRIVRTVIDNLTD